MFSFDRVFFFFLNSFFSFPFFRESSSEKKSPKDDEADLAADDIFPPSADIDSMLGDTLGTEDEAKKMSRKPSNNIINNNDNNNINNNNNSQKKKSINTLMNAEIKTSEDSAASQMEEISRQFDDAAIEL